MEYLIGNADDPRNWGDPRATRGGVWSPLEKVIAPAYRNQFIFVQRLLTDDLIGISMYLHETAGTMILVDDNGQSYEWLGNNMGFIPISVQEARIRLVTALLDQIEQEVVQGIPLHTRDISYYRPLPKGISFMPRPNRPGNTEQSK